MRSVLASPVLFLPQPLPVLSVTYETDLVSVERLGGDSREEWTSAVHFGSDKEVKTVIDHAYGGTLWNARVESTSVVDGIEVCTYNGHCHKALVPWSPWCGGQGTPRWKERSGGTEGAGRGIVRDQGRSYRRGVLEGIPSGGERAV